MKELSIESKVREQVLRDLQEQNVTYPLHHFMETEDMDTDCIEDEMVRVSTPYKRANIHLYGDAVIQGYLTLSCYLCSNPYVYWGLSHAYY